MRTVVPCYNNIPSGWKVDHMGTDSPLPQWLTFPFEWIIRSKSDQQRSKELTISLNLHLFSEKKLDILKETKNQTADKRTPKKTLWVMIQAQSFANSIFYWVLDLCHNGTPILRSKRNYKSISHFPLLSAML